MLSDARIDELFKLNHSMHDSPWIGWRRFARAIEREATASLIEHWRKPLCWLQKDKFGNYHVADESWHGSFPVYGDQSEENKEPKK